MNAHEDERRRVARELHDDLNQRVAELHMRSTVLHSHLNEAWPKMDEQVAELFRTTSDLAEAVQSIVRMLHPVVLDEAGLAPALRALAEQIQREGVEVHLNAPVDAGEVSPAVALCLYRVAQEALRNVVRHAGSAEAEVSLRKLETMIELRIRDAGVGLDPSLAKSSGGLGLTIMRERVAALGGTFELNSRPGEGAEVVACVPRRSA